MTTNASKRTIPVRQLIFGLLVLLLSMGLTVTVAFARMPASSAAGPPIQQKADQPSSGSITGGQVDDVAEGGTPSTTATVSGSATATATCVAGAGTYTIVPGTNPIVPGTTRIDPPSGCDDCVSTATIPFPFTLYDQVFTTVGVDSNGKAQFPSGSPVFSNTCLPQAGATYTIYPYWDDLRTDLGTCSPGPCGIYTSLSGSAPNRIFNIEWRTTYFIGGGTGSANFELRLYEGTPSRFEVIFGTITQGNTTATSGVQRNATTFTQDFCNGVGTPATGSRLYTLTAGGCTTPGTATSTRTPTGGPTATCAPGGTATPIVEQGSITTSDPTQTDRLFRDAVIDTCQTPGSCATIPGSYHYDIYTYQNTSNQTVCVTVEVNTACTGTNFIYVGAYLTSFDPANICQNWVADLGASPNPTGAFSFNVPANTTFVVNVHEVTENAGCSAYTLTITGLPGGGCPTGTPQVTSTTTSTAIATVTCTPGGGCPTGTVVPTTAVPSMTTTRTSTAVIGSPTASVTPCSGRVTICHRTGNGNSHTITVSCNALPAHLAHGDTIGACPVGTPRPASNRFSDVNPGDFFYDFVLDLNDEGAVGGYSDGTFRPYNQATRGQFVKIAVLAFHMPLYTGSEQSFSDVPANHAFYQYIETARRANIIGGYADGTFRPQNNITRGQIAKIAVESAGMAAQSTNTSSFSDVPTNHPFYAYIETAYANGILSGYSDGTFRPNDDATRGQVAKIVDLAAHP